MSACVRSVSIFVPVLSLVKVYLAVSSHRKIMVFFVCNEFYSCVIEWQIVIPIVDMHPTNFFETIAGVLMI